MITNVFVTQGGDACMTPMSWADFVAAVCAICGGGGGGIPSVIANSPLTGNGTAGSPLGISIPALISAIKSDPSLIVVNNAFGVPQHKALPL